MAALRTRVTTVIIPADNEKDLEEIDPDVRSALKFVPADHVDRILDVALQRMPVEETKPAAPKRSRKTKTVEVRQ